MVILGVDPGLSGALALVYNGEVVLLQDMPIVAKLSGKGNTVNIPLLGSLIKGTGGADLAVIERVRAMPPRGAGKQRTMGTQSMFNFGYGAGIVECAVALSGIPYQFVEASTWKRRAKLLGKPKDASRALAMQLYPDAAKDLTRKKDDGRAEAILIARFRAPDAVTYNDSIEGMLT